MATPSTASSSRPALNGREKRYLTYHLNYLARNHYPPDAKTAAAQLGYKSATSISQIRRSLIKQGYAKAQDRSRRPNITLLHVKLTYSRVPS